MRSSKITDAGADAARRSAPPGLRRLFESLLGLMGGEPFAIFRVTLHETVKIVLLRPDLRAVRTFRLLRLLRILKLTRYSDAVRRLRRAVGIVREELVLFLNVALILIFLSAGLD